MIAWIHKFGAPQYVFMLCQRLTRPMEWLCLTALIVGLIWGIYFAPQDYQQGDAFRIIYVHVPAAVGSLAILTFMAIQSVIYLIWRVKVSAWLAIAAAPVGALFTALALITGAIWGKPMWGAWWVWDARLTSELILLFLYLGYLGLYAAFPNKTKAYQATALFAVIAWIDVPIIHYSVEWWHTLHQGSTITRLKPTMTLDMLMPLLCMLFAFALYTACFVMQRVKTEIMMTQHHTRWLQDWLRKTA